jgi:hypothetical protein
MDKKLKAKWVKALTSGRYKQAREALKEESDLPLGKPGYCCLGVLLTVSGKGSWHNGAYDIGSGEDAITCEGDLGLKGRKLLGITDRAETKLILMNDGSGVSKPQASFKEIAAWIRKNL